MNWDWRIAGDGPQLEALRQAVSIKRLDDRIHFLGWLNAEALRREYQTASLFIFPSRHEGMPNAVLEAMASGLPVIATRIAGNEELVLHEETGLLVPPEDVAALRASLRDLIGNATERRRMGEAAHRRAQMDYGWKNTADRTLTILQGAAR
ncbi:MAG TPA: glycosyltransferase family 4 protein, partial [Anaerolineales bacterium]|nr:glycosyltransferase family 4 protein [Anaerolineales bacterium]